jgi:3-oxoadipate enol-lactonase
VPSAQVNELALFFVDDGPASDADTDPILMLHGFARNGNFWADWVPVLSARHRVVRPDLRGCGASEDPGADYEFAVPDLVSDYIGLLDALEIERVHHIGESTGGIVGATAAAMHPDRFASLTLVSTPVTTLTSDPKVKAPGASSPEESLATLGLEQWWLQSRAMTNDLFGDERDEAIARDFARTPLHVALGMWRGMHKPDVSLAPHLPKLRTRTLILTPTGSSTMSVEQQEELVAAIPGARQRIYDGAPHGMYYLRGAELARDVLEFIDAD